MAAARKLSRAAEELLDEHFKVEVKLSAIAVYSDEEDIIRLIEINPTAYPSGRVEPFMFTPGKGLKIQVILADVTPEEWEKISKGEIPLPENWPKKPIVIVPRKAES